METVYCFFKIIAHLNFVDQNKIIDAVLVLRIDIVVKGSVLGKFLKFGQIEIDVYNICHWVICKNVAFKCFQ